MDQHQALKSFLLAVAMGVLQACTPFYSRHYTRGFFYETGASHASQQTVKKPKSTEPEAESKDVIVMATHSLVPVSKTTSLNHSQKESFAKPLLVKPLAHPLTPGMGKQKRKPVYDFPRRFAAKTQGRAVAGEALLYLLALLLALGIIALAIYFLPAILIPSAASSAFTSAIIFAAALVLVLLALVVYTLVKKLMQVFRTKSSVEEEA